jgi:hypothetical protein
MTEGRPPCTVSIVNYAAKTVSFPIHVGLSASFTQDEDFLVFFAKPRKIVLVETQVFSTLVAKFSHRLFPLSI